jgi:MYXO-CTERM domain-containing protein
VGIGRDDPNPNASPHASLGEQQRGRSGADDPQLRARLHRASVNRRSVLGKRGGQTRPARPSSRTFLEKISRARDRFDRSCDYRRMRACNFALKSVLPLLTLGLLLVGPRPAMAVEVMCSNMFGDCSVSNDGFDEIECTCGGGGFGGTGGNDYVGLNEMELMEVCLGYLKDCEDMGGETDVGDWGESGSEDTGDWGEESGDWGSEDSGDWGESGSEESGDWGESGSEDSGSEDSVGTFSTSFEGDGDGDSAEGDGDGDSSGDGDGDGDSSGDGDGDSGDGDGDPGDGDPGDGDGDTASDTNTDDGNNPSESGDSGESGSGASEDGAGGCSCAATNQAPGIGLMLLSLLGLVRLRRRESLTDA